jgi:hypothetical protein
MIYNYIFKNYFTFSKEYFYNKLIFYLIKRMQFSHLLKKLRTAICDYVHAQLVKQKHWQMYNSITKIKLLFSS